MLKKILANKISLLSERSKNILGLYNSDVNKKHNYLKKVWHLDYKNKEDDLLFKSFVKDQISSTEFLLKRYNFLWKKWQVLIIHFVSTLTIVLLVGTTIQSQELKVRVYIILLISFPALQILSFFTPNEKKRSAMEQYLEILTKYLKSDKPIKLLKKLKIEESTKSIYLPFTPAELAAFFGSIYANNEVSGLRQSQVAYFIENYCLQKNGTEYKKMQSMISKYKGDDVDSTSALTDFINKINQKRP